MCLSSVKYGRPPVSLTSNADLHVYTYVTTEPSVSRQAVGATTTVLYRLHKCLMYSKCIRSFLKQWTLLLSLHFSDFQVRNSLAGFGVLICESGKAREPIALRPRLYSPPRADLGAGPLSAACHPEPM